ncbi:MAG TPA: c-type cytochrome [Thermoanaerobaculia bacterium]|nr:c-type cytochrome [Thermoanaerobaculia bacterium]
MAALLVVCGGFWLAVRSSFSARERPSALEAFVARRVRVLGIPARDRRAVNPVAASAEVLGRARAHFADHCAICHGNDGSGETAIGRNLYPKTPDMRQQATQSLSDGQIFWIVKNGVRLTGMPAWGADTKEDDRVTWELVHFIRHLPRLTAVELAEMRDLNPKSREEYEAEDAERRFLENDPGSDKTSSTKAHEMSAGHH